MILKLDASSLTKAAGCPRALYHNISGLAGKSDSISASLAFGSAAHKFAEEFILTGDEMRGQAAATRYFDAQPVRYNFKDKHLNNNFLNEVTMAIESFLTQDRFEILGVTNELTGKNTLLCELKLSIPLYEDATDALLMCGTVDMLIKYKGNGPYVIADWKTTNAADVDKYLEGYRLSTQLMTYRWFIRKLAEKHGPDSVYAKMGENVRSQIFAVSTSAGKMPEVTASRLFEFNREMIDDYEAGLLTTAALIWRHMKEQTLPAPLGFTSGACAGKFSPCAYSLLCAANSIEHRELILNQHFTTKIYDPLTFR